jgi:hypothetical protein
VTGAPWQAWVVEALVALGGAGTPLDVSKRVWSAHRTDLDERSDLFYLWQLELRSAADALLAAGQLRSDADTWVVTDTARAAIGSDGPARGAWTDDELAVVAGAYVSLLRDRDEGRPPRRSAAVSLVREATGRADPAIDGVFAHVSAVVQELGHDFLPAFPPRSNVPRGVRQAVRQALGEG